MKNKQNLKKISFIFGGILIIQFLILLFSNSNEYELKKASEELKYDENYINKSIDEKAEMLYKKELINMIRASRIREFTYNLNDTDKISLIESFKDSLEIQKSSNPKIAIELKNNIEIMENGYNPISFTMEKILGLNSLVFLEHQKNYFYILITVIIYICFFIYFLMTKSNEE